MRDYVKCLREDQEWCTHEKCREAEAARIEALPNPSLPSYMDQVTQTRINAQGQREYRRVLYSAWRVVPDRDED